MKPNILVAPTLRYDDLYHQDADANASRIARIFATWRKAGMWTATIGGHYPDWVRPIWEAEAGAPRCITLDYWDRNDPDITQAGFDATIERNTSYAALWEPEIVVMDYEDQRHWQYPLVEAHREILPSGCTILVYHNQQVYQWAGGYVGDIRSPSFYTKSAYSPPTPWQQVLWQAYHYDRWDNGCPWLSPYAYTDVDTDLMPMELWRDIIRVAAAGGAEKIAMWWGPYTRDIESPLNVRLLDMMKAASKEL